MQRGEDGEDLSYLHTVVDPCRPAGQRSAPELWATDRQRAGYHGTGRHIGIIGANPGTLVVMDEKH